MNNELVAKSSIWVPCARYIEYDFVSFRVFFVPSELFPIQAGAKYLLVKRCISTETVSNMEFQRSRIDNVQGFFAKSIVSVMLWILFLEYARTVRFLCLADRSTTKLNWCDWNSTANKNMFLNCAQIPRLANGHCRGARHISPLRSSCTVQRGLIRWAVWLHFLWMKRSPPQEREQLSSADTVSTLTTAAWPPQPGNSDAKTPIKSKATCCSWRRCLSQPHCPSTWKLEW